MMGQLGSIVRTDDWSGYQGLSATGYERQILWPTLEPGENLLLSENSRLARNFTRIRLFHSVLRGAQQPKNQYENR